jgi:hypothetical protein
MCGNGDRAGGSPAFIGLAKSDNYAMEIKPMRLASLYVEPRTIKRLKLLGKLYPEKKELFPAYQPFDAPAFKSADERADDILNQVLESTYPRVIALERELALVEKNFIGANGVQ